MVVSPHAAGQLSKDERVKFDGLETDIDEYLRKNYIPQLSTWQGQFQAPNAVSERIAYALASQYRRSGWGVSVESGRPYALTFSKDNSDLFDP